MCAPNAIPQSTDVVSGGLHDLDRGEVEDRCRIFLPISAVILTLRLCRHRQADWQAGVVSFIQRPDGIDERLDIMRGAPAPRK